MAVTWERFCGSTDNFAIRLSFMPDPDSGVGADLDDSASWGALQIWVNGQNICAHVDQGEVLQASHWYLLPLLEWLADHWNPLLHEERLPNRNVGVTAVESLESTRNAPQLANDEELLAWEEGWFAWRSRHSIRAARAGGLLPNVTLRRFRDLIEISWNDERLAGATHGFQFSASRGSMLLPPSEVANPLFEVASDAIRYLKTLRPESARLEKVSSSFAALSEPNQNSQRLSYLAGLRLPAVQAADMPSNLDGWVHASWSKVQDILSRINPKAASAAMEFESGTPLVITGSCQAALLFGSVAPSISESDAEKLAQLLVDQYDPTGEIHTGLVHISDDRPLSELTPAWEQGYDLAESLHDEIELADNYVDIDGFIDSLQIDKVSLQLEDKSIRACSLVGPLHKPTIALNSSYAYGRSSRVNRFSLAHELCHLLYDRSHGKRLAIASGSWAPASLERRANAFAAMFLMPPDLVGRAISDCPDPINQKEGVIFIASRLRVGLRAVVEHLYNLTFMSEQEKEILLDQISYDPKAMR